MLANQQVVEQTGRWSSLLSVRRAFRTGSPHRLIREHS